MSDKKKIFVIDETESAKEKCCCGCCKKEKKVSMRKFCVEVLSNEATTIKEVARRYFEAGHAKKDLESVEKSMSVIVANLKKQLPEDKELRKVACKTWQIVSIVK